MVSFIFFAFLIYLAFRLLFGFIIPVYRTTRKVKRGFRAMQEHMQQQAGQHQEAAAQSSGPAASKPPNSDYIDFEEVK